MNQAVQMLEEILGQEVVLYTHVLELSEKRKDALVKGDNEEIEALLTEEERLLKEIKIAETKREQTIHGIASEQSLADEDATLRTLAEKIGGVQGLSLLKLRKELRSLIAKISKVNTLNKSLIETHLQYTSFCMELVTGSLNSTNTYTSEGEVGAEKAAKHILFDGQA